MKHRAWCMAIVLAACDNPRLIAVGAAPDASGDEPDAPMAPGPDMDTPESDAAPATGDAPVAVARITALSVGDYHTCVIRDGGVQCWGKAAMGRLGYGDATTPDGGPYRVTGISSGATAIAAGGNHTCAIVSGAVMCWGGNVEGELGDPTLTDYWSWTPRTVAGFPSAPTAIAAADQHTCAIVSGGVMCWGDNTNAELGVSGVTNSATPLWVTNLGPGSGVSSIVANGWNTCALANGGQWCWGDNYDGELGGGDSIGTTSAVPIQPTNLASGVTDIGIASGRFICSVKTGELYCAGTNFCRWWGINGVISSNIPIRHPEMPNADALTGGWAFGLAVVGGGVQSFGAGGRGTLWPGGLQAQRIDAGADHSCAVVGDDVQCWGWNIYGQLGIGAASSTTTYEPSIVGPWAP